MFDFRLSRAREDPKRFLANFEGILQSDGYCAHGHVGGAQIVHAGYGAHARRKFFEAVKLDPEDQTAIRIVAQMDEFFCYRCPRRARGLSYTDWDVVRQQRARPLLEQIKASIETARLDPLPKSVLANVTTCLTSPIRLQRL